MTAYTDFIKQYATDNNLTYRQAQQEVKENDDYNIAKSISKKIPKPKKPNDIPVENFDLNIIKFINKFEKIGESYKYMPIDYSLQYTILMKYIIKYLTKKYKSIYCSSFGVNNESVSFNSLRIDIGEITVNYQKEVYYKLIKILNCIKKIQNTKQEVLIFDLNIRLGENGHQNLLIYKKSLNVIEHFEPYFEKDSKLKSYLDVISFMKLIINKMNFINKQNNKEYFKTKLKYIEPSQVCIYSKGLQALENSSKLYKFFQEGDGYCALWSIFFAELSLMNPTLSSKELMDNAIEAIDENPDKARNLIRGYLEYIYKSIDPLIKKITGINLIEKYNNSKISKTNFIRVLIILINQLEKSESIKLKKEKLQKIYDELPNNIFQELTFKNAFPKNYENMKNEEEKINKQRKKEQKFKSRIGGLHIPNDIINLQIPDFKSYMIYLNELGSKYETTGVPYKGYEVFGYLFMFWLSMKYKNCRINQDFTFDLSSYTKELYNFEKLKSLNEPLINEFIEQIVSCINNNQKSFVIPIGFKLKIKNTKINHANLLIYRKENNTIEHYDPNGETPLLMKYSEPLLEDIFKLINTTHNMNIKYISITNVCYTKEGLQRVEEKIMDTLPTDVLNKEGSGFCKIWVMFFAELCLLNPNISNNEVLTRIYDEIKEPTNSLYIRNIIRGYLSLLNSRINELFKLIPSLKYLGSLNDMNIIEYLIDRKKLRDTIIKVIKSSKITFVTD